MTHLTTRFTIAAALGIALAAPAHAGCVGTVIMGECYGTETFYDAYTDPHERAGPVAGGYYDKRGTVEQRVHPNEVNPFTGRDPNDATFAPTHHSATTTADDAEPTTPRWHSVVEAPPQPSSAHDEPAVRSHVMDDDDDDGDDQ